MLLVFLQCAWRPGGTFKTREQWLAALWESYSGKRLKEMIPTGITVWIDNSTPKVGDNPDAVFPPDLDYMEGIIKTVKPIAILACGEVAQKGLKDLGIAHIKAPHPAYRALSKEKTASIRAEVEREYYDYEE